MANEMRGAWAIRSPFLSRCLVGKTKRSVGSYRRNDAELAKATYEKLDCNGSQEDTEYDLRYDQTCGFIRFARVSMLVKTR